MNDTDHTSPLSHSPLPRERYLQVVRAALKARHYRFARQAILTWLAAYPGDLEAGLFFAQVLFGENNLQQVRVVLEGLSKADPEYVNAAQMLRAIQGQSPDPVFANYLMALTGKPLGPGIPTLWGPALWNARQLLAKGDLLLAEDWIRQALSIEPPSPLAAVTHLRFLNAGRSIPLTVRYELAGRYSQKWPDCVACTLFLADWSMEMGDSANAVALLHQAVSRDVTGQVARRLWGETHPYRRLWPDHLELMMGLSVPADVSALMGWNRLVAGEPRQIQPESGTASLSTPVSFPDPDVNLEEQPSREEDTPLNSEGLQDVTPVHTDPEIASDRGVNVQIGAENTPVFSELSASPETTRSPKVIPEELFQVQTDLQRLADRLKFQGLMNLDGRFPVYVVLSMRCRLEEVYGVKSAEILFK